MGQWLTGEPIVGVWLSAALASGACCWMLQSWVPLRWAFLGGLLAACKLATGGWGQSYWGGAVAAFGGALLFGGLKRFVDQPRASAGFRDGARLGVLANSRPFEGLVGFVFRWHCCSARMALGADRIVDGRLKVGGADAGRPGPARPRDGVLQRGRHRCVVETPVHRTRQTVCQRSHVSFAVPKPEPAYRHDALRAYWIDWERMRWEQKNDLFGFNTSYLTKIWLFFRFYIGARRWRCRGAC